MSICFRKKYIDWPGAECKDPNCIRIKGRYSMIPEILLWTNLSLLFIHELDAVRKKEWKMLFLLNRLDDETAHRVFSGLHFILFFGVFFFCGIIFTSSSSA